MINTTISSFQKNIFTVLEQTMNYNKSVTISKNSRNAVVIFQT